MSDSLFQVTGVSSGIAWDEIITKLLESAKKPATQWQTKIDTLEVKKTLYQDLQSEFNKLRTTLTRLKLASSYKKKTPEYAVYDPPGAAGSSVVTATITDDADYSSWDIVVNKVANAQRNVSTRFDSVSEALGIAGRFRIQIGMQYTTIAIDPENTLRDINYKLYNAVDQEGDPMAITAKILDNRLVIESAAEGQYNGGVEEYKLFDMTSSDVMYIPHAATRDASGQYLFPPQLLEVSYTTTNVDGTDYTYQYKDGVDFDYDSKTGKIEWKTGTGTRRPPVGAQFTVSYTKDISCTSTGSADPLPPLQTGADHVQGQTYSVFYNGVEYKSGVDFVIDYSIPTAPTLDWTNGSAPQGSSPMTSGAAYTLRVGADTKYSSDYGAVYFEPDTIYSAWQDVKREQTATGSLPALPAAYDYLPSILTSEAYNDYNRKVEIEFNGNTYTKDVDFFIEDYVSGGTTYQVIRWDPSVTLTAGDQYKIRIGVGENYGSKSAMAQLGFIESATAPGLQDWTYTSGYRAPSDAEIEVDGVTVTRSSNTIDDLIANVTLEIKGTGHVKLDIVQDVEQTIEDIGTFVEAYNAVMEWINYYSTQKEDGANPVDETDLLSSIITESKGSTVFGLLHGDQLLWSIKNQLRSKISNPLATLTNSLATKKFLFTAEALNIKGAFYLYVGGTAARIDVAAKDTLEDIQKKISNATSVVSTTGAGGAASGVPLNLTVSIRDGQLVIDGNNTLNIGTTGAAEKDNIQDTLSRNSATSYDYLTYVPITSSPVNGQLTVYSGATEYQEGLDFNVATSTDNNGVMTSRIEWLSGGKKPAAGQTYNVVYSYNSNGVSVQPISGTGPTSGEISLGINGVSYLDFHSESSKIALSSLGITTESADFGKSGYLEFDSDVFFEQIQENPDATANAMMSFMRDMDTYIGNLVDSSNILVAGTIVTKGRIAGALTSVDSEIATLNERITKLEKQLEEKQTALYKRYSDMEQAIQTMNAQMSSISSYLANMSSS